ncbi:MAG: hypothetical protein K2Y39_18090 [Candidatus Obscuribacterales bacterium]|nr:hypothetical protein [Candidatus Obscuribacterales bacterium]
MNFSSIKTSFQIICIAAVISSMYGCASKDQNVATSGYKGVISLDGIKLGVPEEAVKSASLTFVADTNANQPGMTQYLSRAYDKDNGQYCITFVDGQPRQLRVVYNMEPAPKENALARLKMILPASAPEETKVDDSEVLAGKKDSPVEYHYYGDGLKAEVIYANKAARTVKLVGIHNVVKNKKDAAASKTEGGEEKKAE